MIKPFSIQKEEIYKSIDWKPRGSRETQKNQNEVSNQFKYDCFNFYQKRVEERKSSGNESDHSLFKGAS